MTSVLAEGNVCKPCIAVVRLTRLTFLNQQIPGMRATGLRHALYTSGAENFRHMPLGSKVGGEQIMLHPARNRREKSRSLLILPVSVRLGYGEHVGIIRDISASGMFLYSDFSPPIGAEIELRMTPPAGKSLRCTYRAIVVRVTSGVTGAAVGMGLSLMGTRPATALQSLGAALRLREAANSYRTYPRGHQRVTSPGLYLAGRTGENAATPCPTPQERRGSASDGEVF